MTHVYNVDTGECVENTLLPAKQAVVRVWTQYACNLQLHEWESFNYDYSLARPTENGWICGRFWARR